MRPRLGPALPLVLALAIGVLAIPALPSRIAGADGSAPWLDALDVAEDRAWLAQFLDGDEERRRTAVQRWHEERAAYLETHVHAVGPAGPLDELDPAAPRDRYEAQKARLTKGFLVALARGGPAVRVAACRSISDLPPAFPEARNALGAAVDDADGKVRAAALRALSDLRPYEGGSHVEDFLPRIVAHVEDPEALARRAAIDVVAHLLNGQRHHPEHHRALTLLGKATVAPQEEVRAAAYRAISGLAPDLAWSVTVLRRGLDDATPSVRASAAFGLAHLTHWSRPGGIEAAEERLRALLTDPEFDVRWGSANALLAITSRADGLLDVAIEALGRLKDERLAGACRLVCRMGADGRRAGAALVGALGRVPHWRHVTTGNEPEEALYSVGAELADVRDALVRRLGEPEPEHASSDYFLLSPRAAVLSALGAVHGAPDAFAAFALERLASETDPDARLDWLSVLARHAPEHPQTLPLLRQAVENDGGRQGRSGPLAVVRLLGARGEEFLPRLERRIHAQFGDMAAPYYQAVADIGTHAAAELLARRLAFAAERRYAAGALASMGAKAAPALATILKSVREGEPAAPTPAGQAPEPSPWEAAAQVLAALGHSVQPALAQVVERLPQAAPAETIHLAQAIRHAGGEAQPCVLALERLLGSSTSERLRAAAARELGAWGEKAKGALPALIARRDQSDVFDDDGVEAAVAAYRIDGIVKPALERCLYAVRNSHPSQPEDLRALAALGPAAAEAVPDLVNVALYWREEYWKDAERTVAALEALGAIGPAARAALPAIRSLERNLLFAQAAARARREIE